MGVCRSGKRGISVEKTNYRLEIIFDSSTPPRAINSDKVQYCLLTALAISVGGNIRINDGDMKLSVWHGTLADIPEKF